MRLAPGPPGRDALRQGERVSLVRLARVHWYVPVNNAQAYAELCRRAARPAGKLEHDLAAWRDDPPAAVYLPADEPTWAPVGFEAHRAEYLETGVPGLLRRAARMDPHVQVR